MSVHEGTTRANIGGLWLASAFTVGGDRGQRRGEARGSDDLGKLGFLKADASKIRALSAVAVAQNEAGFQAKWGASLDRATRAVADLGDARSRFRVLIALGRAQYQIGRVAEATGALPTPWSLGSIF